MLHGPKLPDTHTGLVQTVLQQISETSTLIDGVKIPMSEFHWSVQQAKGGAYAGEGLLLPMAAISWASLAPFRFIEDCTVPRN